MPASFRREKSVVEPEPGLSQPLALEMLLPRHPLEILKLAKRKSISQARPGSGSYAAGLQILRIEPHIPTGHGSLGW